MQTVGVLHVVSIHVIYVSTVFCYQLELTTNRLRDHSWILGQVVSLLLFTISPELLVCEHTVDYNLGVKRSNHPALSWYSLFLVMRKTKCHDGWNIAQAKWKKTFKTVDFYQPKMNHMCTSAIDSNKSLKVPQNGWLFSDAFCFFSSLFLSLL